MKPTAGIMAALLCVSWTARADEGSAVRDTVVSSLDEVNVTALKQTSALRGRVEAATLATGAELEQLGAVSVRGISDLVPNFYMPEYGSRITSTIYVRGIGARMDQPSVGLIVDNVPYMNKDAYDFDVADIASAQMLRGPQSMLYGRNTMAGVINITTLSPMRWQGWRATVEGSLRRRSRISAGWYHKLSDNAGVSVNGEWSSARGEFINEFNGRRLDWERNGSLRAKLHWRRGSLTVQNTASAGWLRQGGYPYESLESGRIAFNDTCFYRRFTFADGLTLRYGGDGYNLSSVTSVQHIDDNMTLDQDFLPLDYFTLTQKKRETAVTQDLVVRSDRPDSPYSWLGGLFIFGKHLRMEAPVTFGDTGIRELIEKHRNESNVNYPITWHGRSFPLESYFTIPTWGAGIYHESEYRVGNWVLTGGLRLDYERATLRYRSKCDTGYTIWHIEEGGPVLFRDVAVDIDDRGRLHRDFLMLLPKVSVMYTLPHDLGNVGVKWTRGDKSGGFNTQMFSDVLQQRLMGIMGIGGQYDVDRIVGYKPEKSWNYELVSHLALGEVDVDLAAFYIDCRDQQLTVFPDGNTTGRIMTNAGRTRSRGFESSVAWTPGSGWALNASYGFTDARFVRFNDGRGDYKGKGIPYAPRHTLFLQGLWTRKIGSDMTLTVDVNMKGTGEIYWNESNTCRQPFYALLGAGATLTLGNAEVEMWGRNLTATRYRTFYFMSMGNEFVQRGRGLDCGLTFRLRIKQ